MSAKVSVLIIFVVAFGLQAAAKCPAILKTPEECFSAEDLKEYAKTATSIESLYNKYINLLTDAKLTIDGDEPGVNLFFGGELSQSVRKLKYYGSSVVTFLEIALHHVCREQGLSGTDLLYCFKQLNITADFFEICEQYDMVDCSNRSLVYQPVNGVCANHDVPYQGAINTPFRRLIKNSFDDSIHEVRSSAHDQSLPSTRLISTGLRTLHIPIAFESTDNIQNDFLLMYATVVTLDIAKTLKAQTWAGNYGFECCDCDGKAKIASRFFNRHCLPIEIPEKDKIFRGKRCMNYIRAMVTHDNCELKEASVLNSVTHFLDMSFLYAPSNIKKAIRNGAKFVDSESAIHRTIILGDERSAMFPQVYALAVVWIRFHNLVTDEISRLHPGLNNEVKFYEARRFVIAVYQKIFYYEVLPLLISSNAQAKYRLSSKKPCYDKNINPSVTMEFTSSSARFFHKFIQNDYIVNYKNGTTANILLRHFNDELLGYRENTGVITGLLDRPWNTEDIANEPSNFLFSTNGHPGLDLRAIDLQTERDFGIGTYCDVLYYFNLTEGKCIEKFSDFSPFISDSDIEFLKYAYEVPCDVDFGVGASLHFTEDDFFSEIFDRIFAMQFKNLKCGDPYFYINALGKDQINFVDQYSFKDILCYTNPDLSQIQPYVFLTPGENNTKEACSGSLNLQGWKLSKKTDVPLFSEDITEFEVPKEG